MPDITPGADALAPLASESDFHLLYPHTKCDSVRLASLLPVVSNALRMEALRVGKNLDEMIASGELYQNVVASVISDIISRILATPADTPPMTQVSQSALGYTLSGTYLVPGGGLFIKKSELARLGLRRQRIGVIELYDAQGDNS